MMEQKEGKFKLLSPQEYQENLKSSEPKPTICIDEIVEIKGIKFIVKHFKANGKLVLRMIKG